MLVNTFCDNVFLKVSLFTCHQLSDAIEGKVKLSRSDSFSLEQHGEGVYRLNNMAGEESETDDSSMEQDTVTIHA